MLPVWLVYDMGWMSICHLGCVGFLDLGYRCRYRCGKILSLFCIRLFELHSSRIYVSSLPKVLGSYQGLVYIQFKNDLSNLGISDQHLNSSASRGIHRVELTTQLTIDWLTGRRFKQQAYLGCSLTEFTGFPKASKIYIKQFCLTKRDGYISFQESRARRCPRLLTSNHASDHGPWVLSVNISLNKVYTLIRAQVDEGND